MYKRYLVLLILTFIPVIAYNQARTLDFYINAGIQNSPLLKDYIIRLTLHWSIVYLSDLQICHRLKRRSQLLYSPVYRNFGYDEVITNGGNYQGVVGVTQNILNRRDINNKYQSVNIQRQTVTNASKISVAELKRIITEQYLASFADYNELTFNKSFLELAYKENEIVRQFVSQGLCKQTDYLSLQIETQTQEILVNQLKSQYENDLRQLNRLCGLNDPGLYQLSLPELQIKDSPDNIKSPLFIQYKIDSLRIEMRSQQLT